MKFLLQISTNYQREVRSNLTIDFEILIYLFFKKYSQFSQVSLYSPNWIPDWIVHKKFQ